MYEFSLFLFRSRQIKLKNMRAVFYLVLLLSPLHVEPFIPSLSDIKMLFEMTYDIYSKLNEVHDTYNKFKTTASLEDIMKTVSEISQDVNAMGSKIEKKLDVIVDSLLQRLPLMQKIDADSQVLHEKITRIDGLYRDFQVYVNDRNNFNNATLRDFAQAITSHRSSDVNDILVQIHGIIVPGSGSSLKKSFVLLLGEETAANQLTLCDTGTSPQQRLFDIYSTLIITELRAYVMSSFAYTLRSTFEPGDFMREVLHREREFERRVDEYLYVFSMAMKWTPRTLRRCDPPEHKRDVTFFEFERFVQAYIAQEDTFSADHNCFASCDALKDPTKHYEKCDGYGCRRSAQTCGGTITGCTTGVNRMQICVADRIPPAQWNPRRYYWFRNGNGHLFGNDAGGCKTRTHNPVWFWKHTWFSCDVCVCTCIEDDRKSKSYHFVSLRAVVADSKYNMVVTGVRFIREKWVLQIQIQHGRLERDGTIDPSSVGWKKPEDLSFEPPSSGILEQLGISRLPLVQKNSDIAAFNFEKRSINLDELHAPQNHCITGVRFARIPGKATNKAPIQIEIQTTPFDYREGKLVDISQSTWVRPGLMRNTLADYKRDREEVRGLSNLRNPLEMQTTVPDFVPNQYIRVEKTGLREDAGQTTIPLIDALEVANRPAIPLAGLQLFHKRAEGYGSFISFRIQTIDRTSYLIRANKTNPLQ